MSSGPRPDGSPHGHAVPARPRQGRVGYARAHMQCPYCGSDRTKVIDSRPAERGTAIRRRRRCEECDHRFTTYERTEPLLVVRKRSGEVEPFQVEKLRAGLERALADREVPAGTLDQMIEEIEGEVRAHTPPVPTDLIGRAVLERLRSVDEVAYLRFASVYKEFTGARDFEREMAALEGDGGES